MVLALNLTCIRAYGRASGNSSSPLGRTSIGYIKPDASRLATQAIRTSGVAGVIRVQLFSANVSGEWNGPDQAFALAGSSDSIIQVRLAPSRLQSIWIYPRMICRVTSQLAHGCTSLPAGGQTEFTL
eukprot:1984072-Pyramimonas_sp.AAC.1